MERLPPAPRPIGYGHFHHGVASVQVLPGQRCIGRGEVGRALLGALDPDAHQLRVAEVGRAEAGARSPGAGQ